MDLHGGHLWDGGEWANPHCANTSRVPAPLILPFDQSSHAHPSPALILPFVPQTKHLDVAHQAPDPAAAPPAKITPVGGGAAPPAASPPANSTPAGSAPAGAGAFGVGALADGQSRAQVALADLGLAVAAVVGLPSWSLSEPDLAAVLVGVEVAGRRLAGVGLDVIGEVDDQGVPSATGAGPARRRRRRRGPRAARRASGPPG